MHNTVTYWLVTLHYTLDLHSRWSSLKPYIHYSPLLSQDINVCTKHNIYSITITVYTYNIHSNNKDVILCNTTWLCSCFDVFVMFRLLVSFIMWPCCYWSLFSYCKIILKFKKTKYLKSDFFANLKYQIFQSTPHR